jgi:hypothetical protein
MTLLKNENAIEKHKEKVYIKAKFSGRPEQQKNITRRIIINFN